MDFFRTQVTTPPVDDLLEKLESQPIMYSPPDFPPPKIPALRQFLEEEEVLRECRCDNARLINYLSRPEIVMDLVRTTFDLPPLVGPSRPDATGSQKSATSTESPQPVSFREQQKEHHLKHAHVASEILTCDNKRLSEAIVSDDRVMDKVFSYLELAEPGQLHTVVSTYFAKLMVSLLKTRNTLTTSQMAKRDHFFIATLLKHIDSAHVAELVVHILDSPDAEMSYNSPPTNKRPTPEALDLLAKADIFGGLADCFFRASTDVIEATLASSPPFSESRSDATNADSSPSSDARLGKHPLESKSSERPSQKARSTEEDRKDVGIDLSLLENATDSSSANTKVSAPVDKMEDGSDGCEVPSKEENAVMTDALPAKESSSADEEESHPSTSSPLSTATGQQLYDPDADEERRARRRRLREETMFNVTSTMLGLTERMLQLPELGIEIPDRLSVFATPCVVSRLIDAGIYAKCSGGFDSTGAFIGTPSGHLRPSGNYGNVDESNAHRIEAFSTGCNSALMHALGLVADLLTTELNVYHDDTEDHDVDGVASGGGGPSRVGSGRGSLYSGKGIAASLGGDGGGSGTNKASSADDSASSVNALNAAKLLGGKKEGDKLVDTSRLEKELCVRFERLVNMFNDGDGDQSGSNKSGASTSSSGLRPLGSLRLKLAEFFVACIKHGNEETVQRIISLDVPRTLLRLFEKYRWSSMLHGVVTHAIINCLCGGEVRKYGRMAWFEAGLIPWLIAVWSKNTADDDTNPRWGRCGYMGHLIRIGKAIRDFLSTRLESTDSYLADKDITLFREFAEAKLMPAHDREETPLCSEGGGNGDVEGDEGEEATDVLEMGGIQFVEGLGGGSNAPLRIMKYGGMKTDTDLDDEGEIKPVETPFDEDIRSVDVEDLTHFGSDDASEEPTRTLLDGSKSTNGSADQERSSSSSNDKGNAFEKKDATQAGFFSGDGSKTRGKPKGEQGNEVDLIKSDRNRPPKLNNGEIYGLQSSNSKRGSSEQETFNFKSSGNSMESNVNSEDVARAVENTAGSSSSSSDDEGSYESFVDDHKDDDTSNNFENASGSSSRFDAGGLAAQVDKLKVEDSTSPSLDGAVTEIDDGDAAETPDENSRSLGRLAENMMRLAASEQDDDDNSSDDEYESWEDASRDLRRRQDAADALIASVATAERTLPVQGQPQGQPQSRT